MVGKFPILKIEWVEITRGEFTLGLTLQQAEELIRRLPVKFQPFEKKLVFQETPERSIHLDTFYISRFPITWAQFMAFTDSEHWYSPKNILSGNVRDVVIQDFQQAAQIKTRHPACVDWHSALAFCEWIGARLPTSAEWEKSARGTDDRLYPWGSEWDASLGNFDRDQDQRPVTTSPVDAFPLGQSPYGVMDMMGNTYEYTLSTWVDKVEMAVGRSCCYDYKRAVHIPDWFRNRLTKLTFHSMNGGLPLGGFRPVLDEWQREHWPGFRMAS
ncbi:MAG: formylglycine-generating enzyme family protein [Chloroflexi bacterium]|nr:formylglycine-generating enzyme family protein [Chloroflexota bacterium]